MLRRNHDGGQHMFKDAASSEIQWDRGPEGGALLSAHFGTWRETAAVGASTLETPPAAERPARPSGPDDGRAPPEKSPQESKSADQPRGGMVRRHPIVALFGLIALLVAGAATCIYWHYSGHFESTDDAFIAARQYSIAPKV